MKLNCIYLLPIILSLYQIVVFKLLKNITIEEKIRRSYYCIAIVIYSILYSNIKVTSLVKSAPFNLTNRVWAIIVFTIIFYIITMVIETTMISGNGFSEIGFGGATFKKAEKNIKEQSEYLKLVSDQVYSQYLTEVYIKENYSVSKIKDEIINNEYDYGEVLKDILYKYYEYLNIHVTLDIQLINNKTIEDVLKKIKVDYKLTMSTIKRIEKYNKEQTTYYFQNKNNNIAFLTILSDVLTDPIILIIKSSQNLNIEVDEKLIESLLKILDLSVMLASS